MDVTRAVWRKSSHSSGNGGNCVELADLTAWRKSSHSASNGGACVELADFTPRIAIRDSKNPHAGHLTVTRAQFAGLIDQIKTGHLNT